MRNRINVGAKIIMAVVMIVSIVHISPAKASTTYTCTANDTIVITVAEDAGLPPSLTSNYFSGAELWEYALYNSSGELVSSGVYDFMVVVSEGYYLVLAPASGTGTFDLMDITSYEVTLRENMPLYNTQSIVANTEYTLTNTSEYPVFLYYDGLEESPATIEAGNYLTFSPTNAGGTFKYYSLYNSGVDLTSKSYTSNTYNLDLGNYYYTFYNNGTEKVVIECDATGGLYYVIYDKNGTVVTANQSVVTNFSVIMNSGEYIEISGSTRSTNCTATLSYKYYDKDLEVYRAKHPETKKIYIHFSGNKVIPQSDHFTKISENIYSYNATVNYSKTEISQPEDTIGSFTFGLDEIKDTTNMLYIKDWYVYDNVTGDYYKNTLENTKILQIEAFQSEFYNQLAKCYGGEEIYHVYAVWYGEYIISSGNYEFINGVKYSLGEGYWSVDGDNCQYSGYRDFYLDDSSGSYTLTSQ